MTGRTDSRCTMDVEPDVALCAPAGFAGMEPHARAQRHSIRPLRVPSGRCERALACNGRGDGILRASKDDEEAIALRIDFISAGGLKDLTQQGAVAFERFVIPIA